MDCPYYSVCTIDAKTMAPKCVCPSLSECMQTDSNMVNLKAVLNETNFCGTDGVTYPSLCHLEVAACNRKQDIRAYTRGKCSKIRITMLVDRFISKLKFTIKNLAMIFYALFTSSAK